MTSNAVKITVGGKEHHLERKAAIALNKEIVRQLKAQDAAKAGAPAVEPAKPEKVYPFLAEESGGAGTNTGAATIWCGPRGERLPLAPGSSRGGYSCDVHATLLAPRGSLRIDVSWSRKAQFPFEIAVTREISSDVVWSGNHAAAAPEYLRAAVEAAMDKAADYHCRRAYYYQD